MVRVLYNMYKLDNNSKAVVKERFKIGWWGLIILLLELLVSLIAIFSKIQLLYVATLLTIIITTYLITKYIDKRFYQKIAKEIYNREVTNVKGLLDKCNLLDDRERRLPYIIDSFNIELEELHISKRFFKIMSIGFGSVIVPVFSWLMTNDSVLSRIILDTRIILDIDTIVLIIVILFQLLGIFISLLPFIVDMLDYDYNKMKELQSLIKDIYYLGL